MLKERTSQETFEGKIQYPLHPLEKILQKLLQQRQIMF